MARVSQTASPSSTSTGTLPAGLTEETLCLNADPGPQLSKGTMTSSKAIPACRISTHGRMDQEE